MEKRREVDGNLLGNGKWMENLKIGWTWSSELVKSLLFGARSDAFTHVCIDIGIACFVVLSLSHSHHSTSCTEN
jgi:hypothetical protein